MVSIANRMNRYVEPQTTYTAANARSIACGSALRSAPASCGDCLSRRRHALIRNRNSRGLFQRVEHDGRSVELMLEMPAKSLRSRRPSSSVSVVRNFTM